MSISFLCFWALLWHFLPQSWCLSNKKNLSRERHFIGNSLSLFSTGEHFEELVNLWKILQDVYLGWNNYPNCTEKEAQLTKTTYFVFIIHLNTTMAKSDWDVKPKQSRHFTSESFLLEIALRATTCVLTPLSPPDTDARPPHPISHITEGSTAYLISGWSSEESGWNHGTPVTQLRLKACTLALGF